VSIVRVVVTDIVGRPGSTHPLQERVPTVDFGGDWGPADGMLDDTVDLDLHLDSVVDGILVRGTVSFGVTLACARCLKPLPTRIDAHVTELFVDPARDHDDEDDVEPGYELLDDLTAIDLSTLVRDALLIDLPIRVLCRADCAGLCPECGAELDAGDCGHGGQDGIDPRWAALADLDLPPSDPAARPTD